MEASKHMLKSLTLALAISVIAVSASAQDRKITTADFAGTWNIEVMSHQLALVIEPADAATVTATMMAMGQDTQLKGELKDRTLTLTAVKTEANGNMPGDHQPAAGQQQGERQRHPIVVTLQEDGTVAGEMMTNMGPVKWTGEKLRTKKKG